MQKIHVDYVRDSPIIADIIANDFAKKYVIFLSSGSAALECFNTLLILNTPGIQNGIYTCKVIRKKDPPQLELTKLRKRKKCLNSHITDGKKTYKLEKRKTKGIVRYIFAQKDTYNVGQVNVKPIELKRIEHSISSESSIIESDYCESEEPMEEKAKLLTILESHRSLRDGLKVEQDLRKGLEEESKLLKAESLSLKSRLDIVQSEKDLVCECLGASKLFAQYKCSGAEKEMLLFESHFTHIGKFSITSDWAGKNIRIEVKCHDDYSICVINKGRMVKYPEFTGVLEKGDQFYVLGAPKECWLSITEL